MQLLRGGALLVATIMMGMMTGVFLLYTHTIMPGLGRTDDRTFVGAFQALDRKIVNPFFLFSFLGSFGFALLAAIVSLGAQWRSTLAWIVAALVCYLVALVITFRIHLPLNDGLKAAGDPDQIDDLAAARARFNEAKWVRWNLVRAVASLAGFVCLGCALIAYGANP